MRITGVDGWAQAREHVSSANPKYQKRANPLATLACDFIFACENSQRRSYNVPRLQHMANAYRFWLPLSLSLALSAGAARRQMIHGR
jgi:hypothetical protein